MPDFASRTIALVYTVDEGPRIYIDRINEHNPMRAALGDIKSTNPCGEIPLYPGEPCDLGAVNLAAYVVRAGVGRSAATSAPACASSTTSST